MRTAPTVSKRHLWIAMALSIAAAPGKAETIEVTIEKLVFSPASIEAQVGDTIEWVNKDVFAHTATVKGGWEVVIPPNTSASMALQKAEAFDYFCRFHPNMKGHLTVTSP
ncbi:cupredoxin family copper-binding protein [Mesorhizobium sp.]|uniref:cupredoxin domain-containing protein n=1 Tax=Mesorhizobium sp. TaxID=1871066 RepID=UPI000FE7FA8D|nr:cupredoxin family copper-binding protein [Mesorhizobium sp.]RWA98917.1 MAG: amicyanin [Mesorhizobium sp.]